MFRIVQEAEDRWHWEVVQTAYGSASGTEETLAKAIVELIIGEGEVIEEPLSEYTVSKARENPEKFAALANFPEDHIEVKE